MNISITCRHQTRVSRYKKKILQEVRAIKHLDSSINNVNMIFSIVTRQPSALTPVECHMTIDSSSGRIDLFERANSEIRAFNLCFEKLLSSLVKHRGLELTKRKINTHFPYLSIVSDKINFLENQKETQA